jgi:hypothetical protein
MRTLLRFACLAFAASAAAQDLGPAFLPQPAVAPPPSRAQTFPRVSATLSPLWLPVGFPDLTLEYQPVPRWGFALNGMAGVVDFGRGEGTFPLISGKTTFFSAGGHVRLYPYAKDARGRIFNPGRGFHVAAGTAWWHVLDENYPDSGSGVPPRGTYEAWQVDALIGQKWVHRAGFTCDAQVGMKALVYVHDTDKNNGFEFYRYSPILRLNLGWTF